MKILKKLFFFTGAAALLLQACEPVEKRDVLQNSFDPNDIELKVVQSTTGGNKLSIQMNTKGIAGYWDYVIDKKYSDRVEVIFPIPGKSTFTFYVTTPYLNSTNPADVKYISKSVDVQIDKLDHKLPDPYYHLVGTSLQGKTWVFDGVAGDGRLWWYMVSPSNWKEMWWNAAGECCPPADASGKMKFDLDGGANFTYWANQGANPATGTKWAFSSDFTKLFIKGDANILGSMDGGGNSKVFEVKELSDNKMALFVPDAAWGTGWVWVFKPEPTK
jgi:hypothetical protein